MNIKEKLSIVITTHILPEAPSTDIISTTLKSIRDNLVGAIECKTSIFCDSDVTKEQYEGYIDNLNEIFNVDVHDTQHIGFLQTGLRDNYIKALLSCDTPYIFFCEHDWIFLREVSLFNLIEEMDKNNFINYVRFNKRNNNLPHKDNPEPGDEIFWETYVEQDERTKIQPLMKTDCIATHPHVLRVDKFKNDWIDISKNTIPGVTGMIEGNLNSSYKRDISSLGFHEAHKKWGIYNFGSSHENKIIQHLDGSHSGRK